MIVVPDFEGVVTRAATEVFDRIVRRTPVGETGEAQRGWELSQSGNETIIKNDVPYIGILENGWSDQAPNGMVRITLEEVSGILNHELEKERTNESQVQGKPTSS